MDGSRSWRTARCYPHRTLNPDTRLGPYQVISLLGSGGMGEVYEARDTRLDRRVAIKVIPPEFAQRFEREAKSISALNHPHICTLYDVGPNYLVMELLEGESLAQRLARGPLPLPEVLRYGTQIAEALEKAHRQGIVHRDLKPGNIMIAKSGAKLLDFGLARDNANASLADSTMQKPLTAEGTIVGTFQYMAPEQLEGRTVDARTDIFALGAVVYEMATGQRAFNGSSKASLIAAIIAGTPAPISSIQPVTPPALDRVVQICLAKDPDARWQSAHDVAEELRWIGEAGSGAGVAAIVSTRRRSREQAWIAAAALATLLAAGLGFALWKAKSIEPHSLHASIAPPAGSAFAFNEPDGDSSSLTISPDGNFVTFLARKNGGPNALWLRRIDSDDAKPIAGTDNALGPFWSPDSKSIAFFSAGKLRRVDVGGGPAIALADAVDARGGSWSRDGVIIFTPNYRDAIYRVSAAGGPVTPVTKLNAALHETTNRWPCFLPDGKHFLYLAANHSAPMDSDQNAIYAGAIDSPQRSLLLHARTNALFVPGWLLFVRENYIMAQRFDAHSLALSGDPIRIAEGVFVAPRYFRAAFAASNEGTLLYATATASGEMELKWVDRAGKDIGSLGTGDAIEEIQFAPDGKRAAATIARDIWLLDVARGVRTRFTSDPLNDWSPVWSPDGKRIAFWSDRASLGDIFIKAADGLTPEQMLIRTNKLLAISAWSPDGRFLAFSSADNSKHLQEIWLVTMTGVPRAQPFVANEFNNVSGKFSPDMKWLTFVSDETGKPQLYALPFPGKGQKHQISTDSAAYDVSGPAHSFQGGTADYFWAHSGNALYYKSEGGLLHEVSYEHGEFGEPRPLFPARAISPGSMDSYDGKKFLVGASPQRENTSISVITNWPNAAQRR